MPGPEPAALLPVEVRRVEMVDGYTLPRRFTDQIEPRASRDLSFARAGRIEGDEVTAGEVLARLDTRLLEAERARIEAGGAKAQARLAHAESRLRRAERLLAQGVGSAEARDLALADRDALLAGIAEADAGLQSVAVSLEQ